MKKGMLGVEELNVSLQAVLNPKSSKKSERMHKNTIFRCGDKVMQIKNNYDIGWKIYSENRYLLDEGSGVFNGDVGLVQDINDYTQCLTVLFDDGREVEYKFAMLDDIVLAYASTIHKSQGSEYKCVIIPLYSGPPMLLTRNLLYTAITRAKQLVVLVGNTKIIEQMIGNNYISTRNSSLDDRLRELNEYI